MYAVIKTGGKQYRVAPGQTVKIEKLDADEGAAVEFDQVLMVADGDSVTVGDPIINGGKVTATVQAQARHKKIEIIKFKRRKNYYRHHGHRQHYTAVKINDISAG